MSGFPPGTRVCLTGSGDDPRPRCRKKALDGKDHCIIHDADPVAPTNHGPGYRKAEALPRLPPARLPQEPAPTPPRPRREVRGREQLFTVEELAEWLNTTPSHVRSLAYARVIPFIKLGEARTSRVRFDPAAIERWLSQHTIPPMPGY